MTDGYCQNERVDEAINLLREMKQIGFKPDIIIYSTVRHGLCKVSRFWDVEVLLDEMEKASISLDVTTHTSLINGFCSVGNQLLFHLV